MFRTIKEENIQAEIEEKKSKFIANVFYVESQNKAENIIKEVNKKYFDARHNVFAYIVNNKFENVIRFSDDGEPSGTAGAPILNILQKNNLGNILVIVTRYFGGILLGTGGLIRAYQEATIKALDKVTYVNEEYGMELEVMLNYSDFDSFKYYCIKNNIILLNTEYSDFVKCIVEVNADEKNKITDNNEKNKLKILNYKILKEKNIRKNIEI